MKRNDITDIQEKIFFQNYENLFNVYGTSDGDYFYNILRKINIPTDIDKSYYTDYVSKPGDTWTLIAYNFYSDVKLWWIVCMANDIQNPLLFPEAGTVLKIFTPEVTQNILMTVRSS